MLLRHAQAVPQGFEGLPDSERPLTPEGTAHAEALGRLLRGLDFLPGKLFSSPLLRTRETTTALIRGAQFQPEVEFTAALAPGASPKAIQEFLSWRVARTDRVMVVGHQPDMGALVGSLLGEVNVRMPTCGLARVDIERPDVAWSGYLVWLLGPEIYERA